MSLSFGQKLRLLRKDPPNGDPPLSQIELAKRIGYSRNMVGYWERDEKTPPRQAIDAIERVLGLDQDDYDYLLEAAGYSTTPRDEDSEESTMARLTRREAKRGAKLGTAEALIEAGLGQKKPNEPIPTPIPKPKTQHFTGREDEIEWVKQRLLAKEEAALVGVRAIGGMGKTELAIQVVRDSAIEQAFPGGIFWLECGPSPVEAIQERLAQALNMELPESRDVTLRRTALQLALAQRPAHLLVLDDIRQEQLAEFEAVRPAGQNTATLVTSRLNQLPIPQKAVKRLEELTEAQGIRLLTRLLLDNGTPIDEPRVAAIVRLLEQIPLALTLAAGRAEQITQYNVETPLADLLEDLTQRRVRAIELGNSSADLSVRITFDASYDYLSKLEQWQLAQLGLFARNSFDLHAVRHVWDLTLDEAKTAMDQLRFAGLVEQTGNTNYWMHDLLREYCSDKFHNFSDHQKISAHLKFASCWHQILENLDLTSLGDWKLLVENQADIVTAANWMLANWEKNPALWAELAVGISQSMNSYEHVHWEDWLLSGISAADKARLRNVERRLQRSLGEYHQFKGNVKEAEKFLRSSLEIAKEISKESKENRDEAGLEDGQRGVAVTQSALADLLTTRGQYDEAERLYKLSLEVKEKIGDSREVAVTQSALAALLTTRGQYDEAERLYKLSLEVFEKIGDSRGVAVTQSALAALLTTRGQYDEAERLYKLSLEVFEKIGDSRGVAVTQSALAALLTTRGQYDEAERLYKLSLEVFEKIGDSRGVAVTQSALAALLKNRGQYDEAERLYKLSLEVFEKIGDSRGVAVTQSALADLLTTRGQYDEAERLYKLSLEVFEKIGDSREVAVTQVGLADLMAARQQPDEAETIYLSCLSIFKQLNDLYSYGAVQVRLAQLYLNQQRQSEAIALLKDARVLFVKLRAASWVASIDQLLAQASETSLALEKLLGMVRAARQGDHAQGQQAWDICQQIQAESNDPATRELGHALIRLLAGVSLEKALSNLPPDTQAELTTFFEKDEG
jgi:tetratricopeptide (TPR) repeat protein